MANTDTLTSLLDDVGDAIREKTGKTAKMTISEMPTEIASISGSSPILFYALNSRSTFLRTITSGWTSAQLETIKAMIESLDFTGVTSLDSVFAASFVPAGGKTSPKGPSFENITTTGVTSMRSMFMGYGWIERSSPQGSIAYADLILTSFDTSAVTNYNRMFRNATVGTIDISSFDTTGQSDAVMTEMFIGARFDKLITGAGFVNRGSSTIPKALFPIRVKNESGTVFAEGATIPDGAHTYTAY